jgi:hypothetical protein
LRVVIAGVGAFTLKSGVSLEDTGPGLATWIGYDPTLSMALAGTLTVSWFGLT